MELITLADAPPHDPDRIVARPFLDGRQCNVRVIRLSPGQALPPHTHGESDLMLFVAEGAGTLQTEDSSVALPRGAVAYYRGDEELRVRNDGTEGLTLLAFLAPPFPPRREDG